jgi:hypothetical protein
MHQEAKLYCMGILKGIYRIRIDCVSVANHNLIRLLDKPGVSAYSVYKKISFFEQGWEARFQEAHFFRGVGVP